MIEAARLARVTPGTVLRWIRKGLLPSIRMIGGLRYVRRADLLKPGCAACASGSDIFPA